MKVKIRKARAIACLMSVLALFLGLFLPMLFASQAAAGSYSWTQINGLPENENCNDLAWDGSAFYISTGQHIYHYDPGTGVFTTIAANAGGRLLWTGSSLYASTPNGIENYDPQAKKWTSTGSSSVIGTNITSLAWGAPYLYAAAPPNGIWRYDPGSAAWSDTGGYGGLWVYAMVWDGTGLVAEATYASKNILPISWINRYDPGTGLWSNMLGWLPAIYSLAWDGSTLYFGGERIGSLTPATGVLNPDIRGGAAISTARQLLYSGSVLFAGTDNPGIWRFDPSTGTWSDTGFPANGVEALGWDSSNLYALTTIYTDIVPTSQLWRYAYQGAPTLTSLSPTSSPVNSEITINGDGFGASQGTSSVSFGSTKVTSYTSWSATRIKCKVPSMAPGDVQVTVTTASGTSNGLPFTVRLPKVEVISISPTSGMDINAGLSATIGGSDFQTGASVKLENTSAGKVIDATNVNVVSANQITCSFDLTGAPLGSYDVVVNTNNQEAKLPAGFTVTNICGQGAAISLVAFGFMLGLLSLAGTGLSRRRRRKG